MTPEKAQEIRSRHIEAYGIAAKVAAKRRASGKFEPASCCIEPIARMIAARKIRASKVEARPVQMEIGL